VKVPSADNNTATLRHTTVWQQDLIPPAKTGIGRGIRLLIFRYRIASSDREPTVSFTPLQTVTHSLLTLSIALESAPFAFSRCFWIVSPFLVNKSSARHPPNLMSYSLWKCSPSTSRAILIIYAGIWPDLSLHILSLQSARACCLKWCYGTVTVDMPRCIFTSSLVYGANLWNKQMTMENIWIDMYPYPQDLSLQCWPFVELCILRFLPELDQVLAPHVCKGLHSLICKSISETERWLGKG
jgi:hypothetical protein